jgi:hypothetical protein
MPSSARRVHSPAARVSVSFNHIGGGGGGGSNPAPVEEVAIEVDEAVDDGMAEV